MFGEIFLFFRRLRRRRRRLLVESHCVGWGRGGRRVLEGEATGVWMSLGWCFDGLAVVVGVGKASGACLLRRGRRRSCFAEDYALLSECAFWQWQRVADGNELGMRVSDRSVRVEEFG